MSPRWRWFGWLLGLVALAAVAWQAWRYRDGLAIAWSGMASWRLLVALALGILAQVMFALAWHRLLDPARIEGTIRSHASRWLVTLGGKYLPGKIWQGVGRITMYSGQAPAWAVGSWYLREMLLSTSAACLLAACHGLFFDSVLGASAWALLGLSLGLALLAHPAVAGRAGRLLPARIRHAAVSMAPLPALRLASGWLLQLLAYLSLGLGLVIIAGGLVPIDLELSAAILSALCLGGLAGIAAFFVPAGLGVREAMLAGYLVQYMNPGEAGLVALLARAWLTLAEGAGIGLGLALGPRRTSG